MRRLCVLLLPLVVTAAYAQSDDTRLKALVSLRERFMTLGELGDFVAAKSHLKVRVDKPIIERKVTIYCEDKPLGEIMERVATTLFLEWEPEGEGFHLQLAKGVASEEKSALIAYRKKAREAVLNRLNAIADLGRLTRDDVAHEESNYYKAFPDLMKDTSPLGRARRAAADRLHDVVSQFPARDFLWELGEMLLQTNQQDAEALLAGDVLVGSTEPIPGCLKVPPPAEDAGQNGNFMASGKKIMGVTYNPQSQRFTFFCTVPGGSSSCSQGASQDTSELPKEPLTKRLNAWSKDEGAPLAKTFSHPAELSPGDMDQAWTLADHLMWVHDRTGVPIVADGTRKMAGFRAPNDAPTLSAWIAKAAQVGDGSTRLYWVLFRPEKDWLLAKNRSYCDELGVEVPERSIRLMEERATTKGLWMEDYAEYAGALTEAQVGDLRRVVGFDSRPLNDHVHALRLWQFLGATGRAAASTQGLLAQNLPEAALQQLRRAVIESSFFSLKSWDLIPCFLKGGPAFPPDYVLTYRDTRQPGVKIDGYARHPLYERNGSVNNYSPISIQAATISFGPPGRPIWTETIQLPNPPK